MSKSINKKQIVKLTLMLIFSLIFLIGNLNAAEFDNVKRYNETSREVTIKNMFGLGGDIAKIRLISPNNMELPVGYQMVARFEVKAFDDYDGALENIDFYNLKKSMLKIDRTFDYKYLSYKDVIVPYYSCSDTFNRKTCVNTFNITEQKEVWNDLTNFDFKDGQILTIGIFTEVRKGDAIEWIPTFFGFEIPEWASWSETDAVTQAHGVTLSSTGTQGLSLRGMNITVGNTTIALVNITKNSGSISNGTACVFYGTNATGGAVADGGVASEPIACAAYSGNTATFSTAPFPNVTLQAGGKYVIVHWHNGDARYVAATYPYVNSYINWTKGIFNGLTSQNDELNEIVSIGVAPILPNFLTITLIYPPNSAFLNTANINITANVTDDTQVDIVKLFINGQLNETNISQVNGTYNFNKTFVDGQYNWSIGAEDNDGNVENSSVRTFTIDTQNPLINITSPLGNFPLLIAYQNMSLNWTINDANNITSCYYSYNNSNTNIAPATCLNNLSVGFSYEPLYNNITLYGNDSANNTGSDFQDWSFYVIEVAQNFSSSTTEGNVEKINATIIVNSSLTVNNASLIYNGTSYNGTSTTDGIYKILSVNSLVTPDVNSTQVFNFYWQIGLSNGQLVNLTSNSQSVSSIAIDNCTTFTRKIYNFTLVDEEFQTLLTNSTIIETEFNLYSSDRTQSIVNFSGSFTNNPLSVCVNNTLSAASNYSLDVIVRYEAADHVVEFYNIVDSPFSNSTPVQNITLYDLATIDSQEFLVTFKDSNFLPVSDALINVKRRYISEGTPKVVELPSTDTDGKTIVHLVLSDVIYDIVVTKDGEVLALIQDVVAACNDVTIGDCELNLNQISSASTVQNFSQYGNIFFSNLDFDQSTRTLSVEYLTINGFTSQVALNGTLFSNYQNETICSDTANSAGTTLVCVIPLSYGNATFIGEFYADGVLISSAIYSIEENKAAIFDGVSVILSMILFVIIVMMFVSAGYDANIGLIIGALIGFIVAAVLLFSTGGTILGRASAIIFLICGGGIIIWKINKL